MPGPQSSDYHKFIELMKETTDNLKKMSEAAEQMHWQGINEKAFCDIQAELDRARDGWVSSNC